MRGKAISWVAAVCVGLLSTVAAADESDLPLKPIDFDAPRSVILQPASAQPLALTPPQTVDEDSEAQIGLLAGGLSLLTVGYAAAVVGATVQSDQCVAGSTYCGSQKWQLYVPVVGPFLQMETVQGDAKNTARALLAFDGVIQAGGLVMTLAGLAIAGSSPPRTYALNKVRVTPFAGAGGVGLAAMGRF